MRKISISHLLSLCLTLLTTSTISQSTLVSKIKTDKSFVQPSLDPKSIYSIELQRISTSREDQSSKCQARQKSIQTYKQYQKFRVGSVTSRQQSVYEALTVLQDREDGIEGFRVIGDSIMLIMANGSAHFLKNSQEQEASAKAVDLHLQISVGGFKFSPVVSVVGQNAYVATPRQVSFCEPQLQKCTKIEGFKGVDTLNNFMALEYQKKHYLFFTSGPELITYEVSTNGVANSEKIYNASFFNREKIFIEQVIPIAGNQLLILDFYSGLIEVEHSPDSPVSLKSVSQVAYEQYGCRHATAHNSGKYIALQCSLTQKTFFILQLAREQPRDKYSSQQPIFLNEMMTGIHSDEQLIVAKIFSGVRLFWASPDLQSPYPYDFQNAGSIFLHNAKGSEIGTLAGHKVIYICTEEQLRIYQLAVSDPCISCYSTIAIQEQYRVLYTYLCEKQSLLHIKSCTLETKLDYSSWEHKEVNIKSTVLPLTISFMLVVSVGYTLYRLRRKYDEEIELARLKYSSNEQFAIEG